MLLLNLFKREILLYANKKVNLNSEFILKFYELLKVYFKKILRILVIKQNKISSIVIFFYFIIFLQIRFLEEVEHKLDDGFRHPLRKFIKRRNDELKNNLPPHLKRLKSEAWKRATTIEFQPQHFSRHQDNSTRYMFSEKKIK